jgi:Ca-activated chloride channel homolog
MPTFSTTPTLRIVTLAVAGALLLSACSSPSAAVPAAPAAREASKGEAPRTDEALKPAEVVREFEKQVAQATAAPAAADSRNSVNAPQPAPAVGGGQQAVQPESGQGPREIAVDQSRMPIQPTSVAEPQPPVDTTFKDYGVNPPVDPARDAQSTFALDVDTASYAIARKYVNDGLVPPYQAIRAEEFVNYFAQDYTPPANSAFAIYADGAPSPFRRNGAHIMRVGIQGFQVPDSQRKPSSLTFVIDVSGSMNRENRLGLVKRSLELLVQRLDGRDSVSIVVYGNSARVHLPPTNGRNSAAILNAIYQLSTEGSTNTEAGMRLAYQMAAESHIGGGINRVILCSDGVANMGNTEPVSLIQSVRGTAPDDVTLTTIGFGMDHYNDVLMEQLANKGNGFYAYVDTIDEARKMFLDRLTNSLQTIARDAKVQVEFDPANVVSYRLIGYENRAIADQDFRNNAVDAGEVNSGHNATALYEVLLTPGATGRVAQVFLRWQDADTREIREINGTVMASDFAPSYEQASPRYRLNVVVAEYAEILRRSPYSNTPIGMVKRYASTVASELPGDQDVQEFAQLVNRVNAYE